MGEVSHGPPRGSWFGLHYVPFFEASLVAIIGLNLVDLWTSSVALGRQGLVEGNSFVVSLANVLGVQIVGAIVLLKIAAILGGLVAAVLGIRLKNARVKRIAALVMMFLFSVLLFASLNNLYMINF